MNKTTATPPWTNLIAGTVIILGMIMFYHGANALENGRYLYFIDQTKIKGMQYLYDAVWQVVMVIRFPVSLMLFLSALLLFLRKGSGAILLQILAGAWCVIVLALVACGLVNDSMFGGGIYRWDDIVGHVIRHLGELIYPVLIVKSLRSKAVKEIMDNWKAEK